MVQSAIGTENLPVIFPTSGRHFGLTQIAAITILDQAYLDADHIGTELSLKIKFYQYQLNMSSIKYSNDVVNKFILLLSSGRNFANLYRSFSEIDAPLIPNIINNPIDKKQIKAAIDALTQTANEVSYSVKLLRTEIDLIQITFDEVQKEYVSTIESIIKSQDQKVAKLNDEIEQLNAKIIDDLSKIVEGGNDLAKGLSDLGNGVITSIANIPSEKKEKKEKVLIRRFEDDPEPDFAIQAISASAEGAAKGSKAVKSLESDNKKLARLYQELASENAMLTVAIATQIQNSQFIESFAKASSDVGSLEDQWKKVEIECESLNKKIETLDDEQDALRLKAEVEASTKEWNSLSDQLRQIRKAFTGT